MNNEIMPNIITAIPQITPKYAAKRCTFFQTDLLLNVAFVRMPSKEFCFILGIKLNK